MTSKPDLPSCRTFSGSASRIGISQTSAEPVSLDEMMNVIIGTGVNSLR